MSSLVVLTVIVPLLLGLAAGLITLPVARTNWGGWLAVAIVVTIIYALLEGVPPLPPVSSKQKLGLVLGAMVLLAPLVGRWKNARLPLSAVVLVAGIAWIGSNKLLAGAAWPNALWLLPLIAILTIGIGAPGRPRQSPDDVFAGQLGVLMSAIAGAVVALIGGFVGLGQLMGALAAALGGMLIIAYAALLLGKKQWLSDRSETTNWLLGAVLSAMLLITACFAPSPDPIALYLVALTLLAPRLVPALSGLKAILKPFAFGAAAALPAFAAVGVAYWNSLPHP
jgi:hypothetical protein